MALIWNWEDKCGEAVFKQERDGKEFKVDLYEGNAFLIFIYNYKEGDEDMYNLQGFFVDKTHMKRCLGIDKRYKDTYGDNMYDNGHSKITKIRLDKDKCRNCKDIVAAFIEAFDNIEIEMYKGGN